MEPIRAIHPASPHSPQRRRATAHAIDYTAPNAAHFMVFWGVGAADRKAYISSVELYSNASTPAPVKLELWRILAADLSTSGATVASSEQLDPDDSLDSGVVVAFNQETFSTASGSSELLRCWIWDRVTPLVMEFDPTHEMSVKNDVHQYMGILHNNNLLSGIDIGGSVITFDGR